MSSRQPHICIFDSVIKYFIYFIFGYALVSCVLCLCGLEFYGIAFHDEPLVCVFFIIIFFALGKIRSPHLSHRNLVLSGFIVANVIMLTILFSYKTRPISDAWLVYNGGRLMAEGNFDVSTFDVCNYFYVFNWQIGLAWFESLFFRIIGRPSFIALQAFNLVLINATLLLTYRLAGLVLNRKYALNSFLLMCCFYPVLVTVGQIYSNQVVTPLILLFLILTVKRRYVFAGILLPILSFIRPIGIILFIAIVLFLIYEIVTKKIPCLKGLKRIIYFIVPCVLVSTAINLSCIYAKYTDSNVSEAKIPYFKFYQGLNIEEWVSPFPDIERFDGNLDAFNEWQRDCVIEAYIENPGATLGNNFLKMIMFLGSFDWRFAYTYNLVIPEFSNPVLSVCVSFGWAEYAMLIVLCLFGYGVYFKRRNADVVQILFIGMVTVYFFIEAWPSYRYEIYPLMFIFAGPGVGRFRNYLKHII